jgi:hypothetical protein
VWEIRPSEGKQEGFPRAEQAGHSQGQSHLAGVSGFALSKGNLTLAHHSGLAIARLPLTVPPNREGYRPPDYATILYEKNKQPSVARQKKYLVIILEIPEFSPSCPKLRRASLRRTRQRLVQLVLEMCNLDLTTLPSPAHLFPPPSLTPSIHFASFLAGAGVVSVWSHMPAALQSAVSAPVDQESTTLLDVSWL